MLWAVERLTEPYRNLCIQTHYCLIIIFTHLKPVLEARYQGILNSGSKPNAQAYEMTSRKRSLLRGLTLLSRGKVVAEESVQALSMASTGLSETVHTISGAQLLLNRPDERLSCLYLVSYSVGCNS